MTIGKYVGSNSELGTLSESELEIVLERKSFNDVNFESDQIDQSIKCIKSCSFCSCNFDNCDLSNLDISKVSFIHCSFNNANLSKVNVEKTNFTLCSFEGTDMRGFCANRSDFINSSFVNTKMDRFSISDDKSFWNTCTFRSISGKVIFDKNDSAQKFIKSSKHMNVDVKNDKEQDVKSCLEKSVEKDRVKNIIIGKNVQKMRMAR